MTLPDPTPGETARLQSALIQKAARFLILHNDPLGLGDVGELGPVRVGKDYPTEDYLKGLRHSITVPADLADLVTTDDVIRNGLGADPALVPAERIPDIQREIDAAADWIRSELEEAFGVA